jgi:fluoride exporter
VTSRTPARPETDPQPAAPPVSVDPDADIPVPGARRDRGSGRVLGAIALGGVLGGPCRYGLGRAFPTAKGTFPATTFAINVTGAFVLALLLVFILEIWPPTTYVRPFAAVGFCGAYTTFSTWMVDTDRLLALGRYGTAAAYVFGSLVAGLAVTSLGFGVGRGLVAHRARRVSVEGES